MHTQIRQYTLVGIILTIVLLIACNYRVEQGQAKQQDTASRITDGQQAEDIEALSVIEAASALHNKSNPQSEDIQALQVEPHILKQYAGRYDKDN